jgi:hypothetical protein
MASELARKTAEVANRDVGIREDPPNSNRGPTIAEYHRTVGLAPGDPYCIAAICTWIKRAAMELTVTFRVVFSGSTMSFWKRNVGMRIEPRDLTPDDLPCVGLLVHDDGVHGHAYLAIGLDEQTGHIQTIEANTNPAGSREGGGVYALNIRKLKDPRLLGFVRIA